MPEHYLRASIKEVIFPPFLNNKFDSITKRINYAIWTTNFPPFRTYIFTASGVKKNYEKNPHLKGITAVNIKEEKEAFEIINSFYRQFQIQRGQDR